MACAAWSRALATSRVTGNQSSGSKREPAHPASRYTRPASSPSVRSCGSRRTWRGLETTSARLRLLSSGQLVAPSSPRRRRPRIPSPVSGEPSMSGMRARGWRRQGGIMGVTLCVRPGDGGIIVAVSGEVDVCTEASAAAGPAADHPRVRREAHARRVRRLVHGLRRPAGAPGDPAPRRAARRVMRLIATSAAVRRIIELTGTQEALAMGRSTTDRSVQFLDRRTDRTRRRSVYPPSGPRRKRHRPGLTRNGAVTQRPWPGKS